MTMVTASQLILALVVVQVVSSATLKDAADLMDPSSFLASAGLDGIGQENPSNQYPCLQVPKKRDLARDAVALIGGYSKGPLVSSAEDLEVDPSLSRLIKKGAIRFEIDPSLSRLMKRGPSSRKVKRPSFMGYQVSFPQYIRLKNIQEQVIQMDSKMKLLAAKHRHEDLAKDPHWMELVKLHLVTRKMIPEDQRDGEWNRKLDSFFIDHTTADWKRRMLEYLLESGLMAQSHPREGEDGPLPESSL